MADKKEVNQEITAPIDDYLITIADSLSRVQKQLNNSRVLSMDGQSFTTYHLPKLDFELKMSIQLETIEEGPNVKRSVFKASPIDAMRRGRSRNQFEEASTIKGSFIAVPTELGRPPAMLRTEVLKLYPKAGTFKIIVQLVTATGKYVSGAATHFNIDRDLTLQLNGIKKSDEDQFNWDNLKLSRAVVPTNEEGIAASELVISAQQETKVAIVIDAEGKTETLVVSGKYGRSDDEAIDKTNRMLKSMGLNFELPHFEQPTPKDDDENPNT